MSKVKKVLLGAAVFLAAYSVTNLVRAEKNTTNVTKNAVMITNKAANHGGTGIVYKSNNAGSLVLTNDHVCKAISTGGVVRTDNNQYQVQAILESQVSDFCMIYVPSNLKQNTTLAGSEPEMFSIERVSGHPALFPTVVTAGHFSGKNIITVMTGTRECTDADKDDPTNSIYCAFFGLVPILKSYESQLVTSTIMPGSSGSGVYNDKNELSGVVFAGQGDFGYGWIVPYEQVAQFLNHESLTGKWQTIDQTLNPSKNTDESKTKEMLKKCNEAVDLVIVRFCTVLRRDVLWNQ